MAADSNTQGVMFSLPGGGFSSSNSKIKPQGVLTFSLCSRGWDAKGHTAQVPIVLSPLEGEGPLECGLLPGTRKNMSKGKMTQKLC